jgi:hypothetical protein
MTFQGSQGGHEPIVWRALEAILVNVLLIIAVVAAIVSVVFDWVCSLGGHNVGK